MERVAKGFTLIELMIVVAIIGILAAIAMPAYQDYIIRTKISEGFILASAAKTSILDTMAGRTSGAIVAYPGLGLPPAGSWGYQFVATDTVATVAIDQVADMAVVNPGEGRIRIRYAGQVDQALNNAEIWLTPGSGNIAANGLPTGAMLNNAPILWGCTTSTGSATIFKFLPANCRY